MNGYSCLASGISWIFEQIKGKAAAAWEYSVFHQKIVYFCLGIIVFIKGILFIW